METFSLLLVFSGLRGGSRDAHLEMQTVVTTLQNELQIRPPLRDRTRTRLFLFVYIFLLHKTVVFCVVLQNFLGKQFPLILANINTKVGLVNGVIGSYSAVNCSPACDCGV